MEKNVELSFTLNKWGGFEIGDGEYFKNTLKELIETKPDFFVFTEEKEGFFETTFIPNPFNKKDMSSWTDNDWIDMFTHAETYKTSKEQIIERLKKKEKFGPFEINDDAETIFVDDMFWYYLGLHSTGSLVIKCETERHEKFKELINLYEKFFILS